MKNILTVSIPIYTHYTHVRTYYILHIHNYFRMLSLRVCRTQQNVSIQIDSRLNVCRKIFVFGAVVSFLAFTFWRMNGEPHSKLANLNSCLKFPPQILLVSSNFKVLLTKRNRRYKKLILKQFTCQYNFFDF